MRSALIGFGRIGNSIRHDKKISEYFTFSSHAQVLSEHPCYEWVAVVDPVAEARRAALEWEVPSVVGSVKEISNHDIEFAVLAIPPGQRIEAIKQLPTLKSVLIEKPMGAEGANFLAYCKGRGIDVSINFWRRGDRTYRELASGGLKERIGKPQAVFCTYGNGLFNNGSHLVDFIQMLFGEVKDVITMCPPTTLKSLGCSGPMDDYHATFVLCMDGFNVMVHPVNFDLYREVGVDIWGEKGRLAFYQESLGIFHYPVNEHRAMERQKEVSSDAPKVVPQTVGDALYNIYTSINYGKSLSPATMKTEDILNRVIG